MFLTLLSLSPALALAWIIAVLMALTVHEFAHAVVGKWRGDHTAEQYGRLTLNPLAHLDPLGTVMLILVGFGWAKPVPFDPQNLKRPLEDGLLIALAGPFSNLLLAGGAALIFRGLLAAGIMPIESALPPFLLFVIILNLSLLFFNLIPIPPLDGSKMLDLVLFRLRLFSLRDVIFQYAPTVLTILVFISILTNIDVFFFVHIPAEATCNALVGTSCFGVLGSYF